MAALTVAQLSAAASTVGGFSFPTSFYVPSPYAYTASPSFSGWRSNPFAAPPPRNPFADPLPDPQAQPGPDSAFRTDPFGTNPDPGVSAVNMSALAGVAVGAVFAVIGFLQQRDQNKAIAKASKLSMERVNLHLTNMRVNRLLQIVQIAHRGQKALGNFLNSLPSRGIAKLESIMNQIVDPTSRGTWAEFTSMEREDEAARQHREVIAARASAGMISPIVAAVGEGAKGFQIGVQAGAAFESARDAEALNVQRQFGYQHRNFGFRADMRGLESALRNSGIDFTDAESLGMLSSLLNAMANEAGQANTGIASAYVNVENARGGFYYNRIRQSSIGSGEAPANLFGIGQ